MYKNECVRNSTKESTIVVIVIGTIFVVEIKRGCEYHNDKFGKKTNSNYELQIIADKFMPPPGIEPATSR